MEALFREVQRSGDPHPAGRRPAFARHRIHPQRVRRSDRYLLRNLPRHGRRLLVRVRRDEKIRRAEQHQRRHAGQGRPRRPRDRNTQARRRSRRHGDPAKRRGSTSRRTTDGSRLAEDQRVDADRRTADRQDDRPGSLRSRGYLSVGSCDARHDGNRRTRHDDGHGRRRRDRVRPRSRTGHGRKRGANPAEPTIAEVVETDRTGRYLAGDRYVRRAARKGHDHRRSAPLRLADDRHRGIAVLHGSRHADRRGPKAFR